MSDVRFPGPEVCSAMESLHHLVESCKVSWAEVGITDEHIAIAMRELADWYDPCGAAKVVLKYNGRFYGVDAANKETPFDGEAA